MAEQAAPVIEWEMARWVDLGGGNSGILGDRNHDSGFHRGARFVPATDYSRRRDPNGSNGPFVDWDFACAGDFSHRNIERLRKEHRRVLNGLMNGEYPMLCEFIGKPWADRPVYYWARWNRIKTLRRYTGSGHTHWSHISWWRSEVDKPANLWTPGGNMFPKYGEKGQHVRFYQRRLNRLGFSTVPKGKPESWRYDGTYGDGMQAAVEASRRHYGWDNPGLKEITGWHAEQMDTDVAKMFAGQDGKDGDTGPRGLRGLPGKDGVLPAEIRITGTATVSPPEN